MEDLPNSSGSSVTEVALASEFVDIPIVISAAQLALSFQGNVSWLVPFVSLSLSHP